MTHILALFPAVALDFVTLEPAGVAAAERRRLLAGVTGGEGSTGVVAPERVRRRVFFAKGIGGEETEAVDATLRVRFTGVIGGEVASEAPSS